MLDDNSDTEISKYFYSNLIATRQAINGHEFKKFTALNTGSQRVAFILKYPEAHRLSLKIENPEIKHLERCLKLKEDGNQLFGQGNFTKALEVYSNAILLAPKKELGVLFANRSATLYHLENYELALIDMEESVHMGYPKELMYKIEERRARCFLALKRHSLATESFKNTLKILDDAKLPLERKQKFESDMRIMLAVMERACQMIENGNSSKKISTALENSMLKATQKAIPKIKNRNPLYPAFSKAVKILDDGGEIGRHGIATRNIEPGEIIAVERPYSAVLLKEYRFTNCHLCQKRIIAPQPASCYVCSCIAYCSRECRNADEKVHKIECDILSALWCSDASVTCIMALKSIIQQPLEEILKLQDDLNKTINISKNQPYKGDDYRTFHNLVTHKDERTVDDLFHRAYIASWLLRLLKTTSYIPENNKTDSSPEVELSKEELFIANLIYHNLQLLQFNSHEISELRKKNKQKTMANAKSIFIGGGVYPTMALLNHSCNPGVIRYFVGTTMIIRAVRTIYEGTEVCDNYGPIFTETPEKERQRILRVQYWFECQCEACNKHWPLIDDIDPRILRFKCETGKTCGNVLPVKTDTNEFMISCSQCGKSTNILKGLKALQDTDVLFNLASKSLEEGNYEQALKSYLEILKLLDDTLALPIKDYHICQQGVRLCALTLGNTAVI